MAAQDQLTADRESYSRITTRTAAGGDFTDKFGVVNFYGATIYSSPSVSPENSLAHVRQRPQTSFGQAWKHSPNSSHQESYQPCIVTKHENPSPKRHTYPIQERSPTNSHPSIDDVPAFRIQDKFSIKYNLNRQSLKLPKGIPDVIDDYMRSDLSGGKNHVINLWSPSPNSLLPDDIQERNIQVGDVARIDLNGGLDIIFNIFLTAAGNKNVLLESPPAFVPCDPLKEGDKEKTELPLTFRDNRLFQEGKNCQTSTNFRPSHSTDPNCRIVKRWLIASSKSLGGSQLVYPDGLVRIALKRSRCYARIRECIMRNGRTWSDLLELPKGGDLVIVTACYNAKTWAAAALKKGCSGKVDISLCRPHFDQDYYEWVDCKGGAECIAGPGKGELKDGKALHWNQCLAIEGISISLKGAGPSRMLSKVFSTLSSLNISFSSTATVK